MKRVQLDEDFHYEVKQFATNNKTSIKKVIIQSFYFYRKSVNKAALESLKNQNSSWSIQF